MKKILSIFFCGVLLCWASALLADNSPHLQDNAGVISQDMANKLENVLTEIDFKKGVHIEEVILPNFDGRTPQMVVNAYYQQLEHNDPLKEKRILLLIALNNGFVAVQATPNLSSIYKGKVLEDITTNITTQLRAKNYDEMARVGIAGVYHYYEKGATAAAFSNRTKIIFSVLSIVLMIIVVGIIRRKTP